MDDATSIRLGKIRQHGTTPELLVRGIVRSLGSHYRVSNRDLPGSPDLANRSQHWAVFVHGCFWHSHARCVRATVPKRNRRFWTAKLRANQARDKRSIRELRRLGFRVFVVWECELEHPTRVLRRLRPVAAHLV